MKVPKQIFRSGDEAKRPKLHYAFSRDFENFDLSAYEGIEEHYHSLLKEKGKFYT
jgi:hypothetical protein